MVRHRRPFRQCLVEESLKVSLGSGVRLYLWATVEVESEFLLQDREAVGLEVDALACTQQIRSEGPRAVGTHPVVSDVGHPVQAGAGRLVGNYPDGQRGLVVVPLHSKVMRQRGSSRIFGEGILEDQVADLAGYLVE